MAQTWKAYVGDIPIVGTEKKKKDVEFIAALCHGHLKLVEIGRLLGKVTRAVAEQGAEAPVEQLYDRLEIVLAEKGSTIPRLLDVLKWAIDEYEPSSAVGRLKDVATAERAETSVPPLFYRFTNPRPVKYSVLLSTLLKACAKREWTAAIGALLEILRVAIPETESSAAVDESTDVVSGEGDQQESSAAVDESTDVVSGEGDQQESSAAVDEPTDVGSGEGDQQESSTAVDESTDVGSGEGDQQESSAAVDESTDVVSGEGDQQESSAAVDEPTDVMSGEGDQQESSAAVDESTDVGSGEGDQQESSAAVDVPTDVMSGEGDQQESSAAVDVPTYVVTDEDAETESSAAIDQLLDILKRTESAAIDESTDVATEIATEHVSSAAIGGSVSIPEECEWVYGFIDQFVLKGVTKEAVMEAVKGTKGKSGKGRYGKWPKKTTTPHGHAPHGGAQGGAEGGAQGGTPQSGATRGGAGKQKTSKRPSAHVINTNVLRVFRNMIDKFRNFRPANEIDANNTPTSYLAYHCEADYCPLPNMRRAIQDMKVDPDEDYIDVNATTYGWSIAKLNEAVVCFMIHLCDHPNAPRRRMYRQVKRCVSKINNETLYVDRVARLLWLAGGDQERLDMYSEAKDAVERMFQFLAANKGKVRSWVGELKL